MDDTIIPLGYNDEKMDSFYYYEKKNIIREEYDTNNDGKIDMWVKYNYDADNSLKEIVIEKNNNYDGTADEWQYTDNKRQVIKIEKSTHFDGKKDYVKNF